MRCYEVFFVFILVVPRNNYILGVRIVDLGPILVHNLVRKAIVSTPTISVTLGAKLRIENWQVRQVPFREKCQLLLERLHLWISYPSVNE